MRLTVGEVILVARAEHEWQEAEVFSSETTWQYQEGLCLEAEYLTGPWAGQRFFTPLHEEGRIWVRIRKNGEDQ